MVKMKPLPNKLLSSFALAFIFTIQTCAGNVCMAPETDRGSYNVQGRSSVVVSLRTTGAQHGSRVDVTVEHCPRGFQAQQPIRSHCLNGTWTPPWPTCERPRYPCAVPLADTRSYGQCHYDRCYALQFINGSAVRDIRDYYGATLPDGTWLVARCEDPGRYRLVGESRRLCTEGEWSAPEPTCERPRYPCAVPLTDTRSYGQCRYDHCDALQFIDGSAVRDIRDYDGATLPDGTWLVARCEDPGRYRLVGESTRHCTEGEWSAPEPTCERVFTSITSSGVPTVVAPNGTIFIYPRPSAAHDRHQYIYCEAARRLDESVELGVPRNVSHVRKKNYKRRWWSPITRQHILLNPILPAHSGNYSCSTSNSNAHSHTVEIIIREITCRAPVHPANGSFIDRDRPWIHGHYTIAKKISFECNPGFILVGASSVHCTVDGWSKPTPMCTPTQCPEISTPANARMVGVYGTGRSIGDERAFYCNPGYIRRGYLTNLLRCNEGGEWSGPVPTCEPLRKRMASKL